MSIETNSRDRVRVLLASADPAVSEPYDAATAGQIMSRAIVLGNGGGRTGASARPRFARHKGKAAAVALGVTAVLGGGGMAVAALAPPGTVATPPMAPPVIRTGEGATTVALPPAPPGARYVRIVVACFEATRCLTPGGGSQSERKSSGWTMDALPLTGAFDPDNPQRLQAVDPQTGVRLDVSRGGRWRLWAVYVPSLNPTAAPVGDGRRLGIPSSDSALPELIPATTTTGSIAWIPWSALTESDPQGGPHTAAAVGADAESPAGVVSLR